MNQLFFQLASHLAAVRRTDESLSFCKQALHKIAEENQFPAFFDYCNTWKLAPWIATQLKQLDLASQLPHAIIQQFDTTHDIVLQQNTLRNSHAKRILERFVEQNIPVIILKGNCLAHEVYHDPGYKRMNDFDILIQREDWSRIQEIYCDLGYIPLGFGWNGEKEKPAKFSHVGMSFISPDFSCIIGSQWGLKSPTTSYNDCIQEAWQTAEKFDFMGVPVRQLSPEFHLLHLILHMGIYKCGIRDCMDVFNLLLVKPIDTSKMVALLQSANAVNKASFTLSIAELSVPGAATSILHELGTGTNDFLIRRKKDRLKLHALTGDYQAAYNDYFQDIEKEVIYFNLFPQFHRKCYFYLRIIGLIFLPDKSMIRKLNDLPPSASELPIFFLRFTTPGRIFALIAQEIGWKFTCLLFLKLGIDCITSLVHYLIPKKSYFDYLKSRNIDPKAIEKVVKNIQ
jgi:hypothetical protein